jgi:hypothetical protein
MLLMYTAPGHYRVIVASTIMFGFFLSNMNPSIMSMVEQHIEIGRERIFEIPLPPNI